MAELDLPPLTVTMGPCLVGAFLSATYACLHLISQLTHLMSRLYGVTALQTFQYFNKYGNKDKLYIRLLVSSKSRYRSAPDSRNRSPSHGSFNSYSYPFATHFDGRALDTFGVASNMYCMWLYLVKNAQNPLLILHIDWSLAVSMTRYMQFMLITTCSSSL